EYAHDLGDERHGAEHVPRDLGRIALGLEPVLDRVARLERALEVELELHEPARIGLRDLHAPCPGVAVAIPLIDRALALLRAAEGPLHVGIELFVRRPLA